MRLATMIALCLLTAACGGDSGTEGDAPTEDGPDGDGDGGDDTSGDEDSSDGEPTDDADGTDDGPGDDDESGDDDGSGVLDVWSCHRVQVVGVDGQTVTTCTQYEGRDAKAFAEPSCVDLDTLDSTLANAACSLEGAVIRCEYEVGSATNVFYADTASQLETNKMACEAGGGVVTIF
jgi:hypothetical protein